MGRYSPIWRALKANGTVSVAMHRAMHKNLVRQMSVEKDRDIGYKISLGNENKKALMSCKIQESKVTFRLTLYYLNGLPVIDLKNL
jgi:hypothetical protein